MGLRGYSFHRHVILIDVLCFDLLKTNYFFLNDALETYVYTEKVAQSWQVGIGTALCGY